MNANKRHLYGLILVLLLVGLSVFFYRHAVLDVPLTDTENVNSWMVEAHLHFQAEREVPVKASFTVPYMPPNFSILDEYFVAKNYGVTTNLEHYNRRTVWSLRRGVGPQSLYYRAIVRETGRPASHLPKPIGHTIKTLEEHQQLSVESILNVARQSSADIQTFAQAVLKELNKKEGNARLLSGDGSNDMGIVNAAVLVLNQAKIHALPVQGIYLNQHQSKLNFSSFLAVYNDKTWVYLDPQTGARGLPKNFLVWQYQDVPVFDVLGGKKPQFALTVSLTPMNALSLAKTRGLQMESGLLRFSLLELPIHVQEAYKILLTVPIGAFIILLLRNFVGLKTFGTFMPVLIAMAFRETQLVWGVFLFTLIVSFGLLARFYLDQLKLLLVPRLAAILTVVILLMIFISVLSQNLALEAGVSVALFPMVILTMTIERMCIMWDERGAQEAIKAGLGSLLAAIIAFSVMNESAVQYLFFAFPELLLVLLAIILWFGQYRGYRVLELFRFSSFARVK